MPRLAVAAAALLSAVPVGAEEADDAIVLAACLTEARGKTVDALFESCIAEITESCLAGTKQKARDVAPCIERERAAWEVLLDRHWQTVRQDAQRAHDEEEAEGADSSGVLNTLLAAQRAWLAFRDAECAHAFAEWEVGPYRPIAAELCQRNMTARRAIELRQRAPVR